VIRDTVKDSMVTPTSKEFKTASIRQIASFDQYLRNLLAVGRRLTPLPVSHLYDAAYSCMGKGIAKAIASRLLNYPCSDTQKVLDYLALEHDALIEGGSIFDVPDLSENLFCQTGTDEYCSMDFIDHTSIGDRLEFITKLRSSVTRKELESLVQEAGTSWAVEKDYKLHEIACANVRRVLERTSHIETIRKSFGSLGDGVHWKSTIASRATEENAIRIRLRKTSRAGKPRMLDEFTPVVFLFGGDTSNSTSEMIADFNITKRNRALGNDDLPFDKAPPPDHVYTIFYTFSEEGKTCEGHITRKTLITLAFLCTRHVMGVRRYEKIVRRPAAYQCRTEPMFDPDLDRFPLSEKGVAWAIKYAASEVLVAAENGWKASGRLKAFAESRKVHIIPVSTTGFSPDFIERLRKIYQISTPLKKHPNRDNILKRFM
jgi:hypothetical protein